MDVSEFKQVYQKEGSHNLKVQIPYLASLARHYEELGRENPRRDWTALLKAHALHNSCAARCGDTTEAEKFTENAFKVQNCYLKFTTGTEISLDHLQKLRNLHVSHLEKIRLSTQKGMTPVAEQISLFELDPYLIGMSPNTELIEKCVNILEPVVIRQSGSMIDLAGRIISDSVALMSEVPPCHFEAIALGSLARGESTPYSDLEFLFLLEHKDQAITVYFETLALTVYFLIGNLQETKLKYMAIEELSGWFDDKAKNGFKIDGLQKKAGNIPTGNGTTNGKNKFICTAPELAQYYSSVLQNPPDQDKDMTGDDSDLLTFTGLIYHHSTKNMARGMLLQTFTDLQNTVLPNQKRNETALQTLCKDLTNHFFQPMMTPDNMQILAKSHMYRFTSLIIMNLKIRRQMQRSRTTTISDDLHIDGFIKEDFAAALRKANLLAMLIRLSCYIHHDSQQDEIDLLEPHVKNREGILPNKLYVIYYSLILEILNFYLGKPIEAYASRCESAMSVALSYLDYDAAVKYADTLLSIQKFDQVLIGIQITLAKIYQFRKMFKEASVIVQSISKHPSLPLFSKECRFEIDVKAWSLFSEMESDFATEYFNRIKESSVVEPKIFYLIHEANDMHNTALHRDKKNVKVDVDFMKQILRRQDSSKIPLLALAWAFLYTIQGDTKQAIKWAERSLELHTTESDTSEQAVTKFGRFLLQFLACACCSVGKSDQSESYAKKALVSSFKLNQKPPIYIGRMYNVLSQIYLERGDIPRSVAAGKKARECWDQEEYRPKMLSEHFRVKFD